MLPIVTAFETTTSHAVPRTVSNRPLLVRLAWLLLFLVMVALFLKGFIDFVIKLQSRQVTNSLEANSLTFQFPDVYVCAENPISGSYSANLDSANARAINARLNATRNFVRQLIRRYGFPDDVGLQVEMASSASYPQTLPYNLLIDALAHRSEQMVITSGIAYNTDYGMPEFEPTEGTKFYHPSLLTCLKWSLNSTWQRKINQAGSASGIVLTLNTDNSFSGIASTGASILPYVYARNTIVPVSDWSLSMSDFDGPDRRSGVRIFLTPPGEYPSDYVTSFSLGPGKHHTVDIDMTQLLYKEGQFDCVTDAPEVQFVNPYDQTPYSHSYSYSYCYYTEYHKQFQALVNMSGITGPLPWPLNGPKFVFNLTGEPTFFVFINDSKLEEKSNLFDKNAKAVCEKKRPCSTLDYSVSISNADWPTQSSLAPFVSSSVKQAWTSAKAKNLSVPALDFLMTGNASSVASYVRSNLLKVHFRPPKNNCEKVTFSIDYVFQSFVSDVGGIMGIYLGMSLLTIFEVFELLYEVVSFGRRRVVTSKLHDKNNDNIKKNMYTWPQS